MYIITAIPGACGDIVSSIIDSKDTYLLHNGSMLLAPNRNVFKKSNLNMDDVPYMLSVAFNSYKSISSQHSIVKNIRQSYMSIAIDASNNNSITWCISRLQKLYPNSLYERNKLVVDQIAHCDNADKIINLKDILSGNLIKILSQYIKTELNSELYFKWLSIVREKFPYNF